MKRMIILRGVPGAGKSHYLANEGAQYGTLEVVSADHYFIGPDGVYRFDPAKIGQAHNACFRQAIEMARTKCPCIVIDNTNTSVAEIAPYYLLGQSFGYDVEIVLIEPPSYELAAKRNVHGVPLDVVRIMAGVLRTEKLPPWWKQTVVRSK